MLGWLLNLKFSASESTIIPPTIPVSRGLLGSGSTGVGIIGEGTTGRNLTGNQSTGNGITGSGSL